jgi:acyl-CoA reductase-like NAD-dependent aldehyde dehydrogenase
MSGNCNSWSGFVQEPVRIKCENTNYMRIAADDFKRLTLECGGKSVNIVLDDADLNVAIDGSLYGMFYHSGQCCEAATRLFVHEKIYDSLDK